MSSIFLRLRQTCRHTAGRAVLLALAIIAQAFLPRSSAQDMGGTLTISGGTLTRLGGSGSLVLTPSFFDGEAILGNGVNYLVLPNGHPFGYYSRLPWTGPANVAHSDFFIYHFDMGYEHVGYAFDSHQGIYLYDFASNTFFYTSATFPFPYLYDFSLNAVLYYFPDPNHPGRYNTNGVRYFYNFATGQVIAK